MRQPAAMFARGIHHRLAGDPGWRAFIRRWRLPAPPRLIRLETKPWQSATFDGWLFDFTLEASLPAPGQAVAPLLCDRLSAALHDADLPLPGQVVIELTAVNRSVEAPARGAATCRVTFNALTVAD
ncbi:MAG: hypothetical protein Tsb0016_04200 [Sphingomonadales bacterium]